jgi:hypothetical protein
MFQLRVKKSSKGPVGRIVGEQAPYRGATVGLGSHGAKRVASLEGEGLLDGMNWGKIVVFDFAKLEKTGQEIR